MNNNSVGWFEIPVTDMDRAIKFYQTVFDVSLSKYLFGSFEMAWFPEAESDRLSRITCKSEGNYNRRLKEY
jgi:predicted enzyme related to lactoylglutathione lyase